MIRYFLLLYVALFCWQCSSLQKLEAQYEDYRNEQTRKHCDGLYAIGRYRTKISGYDEELVELVFLSNGEYKLNQDSIAEYFHTSMNIYLSLSRYGIKMPKAVEAFYRDSTSEVMVDSSDIRVFRDVHNRVSFSINKDFPLGKTHVKLIAYSDDVPSRKTILDFDILEKGSPGCWSKAVIQYLKL